jgi:adenylate cyclase
LFKLANTGGLRAAVTVMVGVLAAGIAVAAYATGVLDRFEGSTVDARFAVRGEQRPLPNIVIVKIDDATFQALNLTWPFQRKVDARLIDRISAQHPAAIAYDVQFTEKSSGSAQAAKNDELTLLLAIQNARRRTVFSTTETDAHGHTRFLGSPNGTELLREVGSRAGNGLFPFQADGVIRQMAYSIGNLKTFAVVAAEVATHRRISRSAFDGNRAWIDFRGPSGTFPSVSFSDALNGHVPHDFFRGKIVVIGATAPTLQDIHPTSTDSQMAGPEIQANAIDNVLRGFPLAQVPGWMNVALILLFSFSIPLACLRVRTLAAMALAVALALAFTVGVQLAFNSGWIVAYLAPMVALLLSTGGSLAVMLMTEAFERIRVRDMFARFVPENVVDEVLASAHGLRLGGVQREGTVMFTDLRGFTSMAETLSPARVIEVLNRYLSEMSDAILDHGGTLVAYMGDGIMAVFGAPLPQEDHADRALAAAREMLDLRLPRFNEWLRSEQLSEGFRMGIGLNSGHVMSGHVGSERRVEYTAVGDTTNTASRIEALTKGTPHQLLLAGSTKEALRSPPDDLVHVGETEIRGRTANIELWSLDDGSDSAVAVSERESLKASRPAV